MPPSNLARRIEHRASSIPVKVQEWETKRAELDGTRTDLERMAERVWDRAPHLEELRGRRDALVAEMLAVAAGPKSTDQSGIIEAETGTEPRPALAVFGDPFAPTLTPPPAVGREVVGPRPAP